MPASVSFEFVVDETWDLSGRFVLSGTLVSGDIHVGDRFEVVGSEAPVLGTVRGLEFHIDRRDDPRRHGLSVDADLMVAIAPGAVLRAVPKDYGVEVRQGASGTE